MSIGGQLGAGAKYSYSLAGHALEVPHWAVATSVSAFEAFQNGFSSIQIRPINHVSHKSVELTSRMPNRHDCPTITISLPSRLPYHHDCPSLIQRYVHLQHRRIINLLRPFWYPTLFSIPSYPKIQASHSNHRSNSPHPTPRFPLLPVAFASAGNIRSHFLPASVQPPPETIIRLSLPHTQRKSSSCTTHYIVDSSRDIGRLDRLTHKFTPLRLLRLDTRITIRDCRPRRQRDVCGFTSCRCGTPAVHR
jgi:hypothetical protein